MSTSCSLARSSLIYVLGLTLFLAGPNTFLALVGTLTVGLTGFGCNGKVKFVKTITFGLIIID